MILPNMTIMKTAFRLFHPKERFLIGQNRAKKEKKMPYYEEILLGQKEKIKQRKS